MFLYQRSAASAKANRTGTASQKLLVQIAREIRGVRRRDCHQAFHPICTVLWMYLIVEQFGVGPGRGLNCRGIRGIARLGTWPSYAIALHYGWMRFLPARPLHHAIPKAVG